MTTETESEFFINRKEAHAWLEENGFVVSSGKFYGDCKKGFPAVRADKTVSKYQVAVYGQNLQKETTPDLSTMKNNDDEHRKNKADADIAEMKAVRMRKEEDDMWLHADTAWSAIAALIGSIREAVRHQLHTASSEIVVVAGGDVARAPEVFEMMDAKVDVAFNEIAGKEIVVNWKE